MAENFDIIIVGGGMVGTALACAFADTDLRIAVVEAREVRPFDPNKHDIRVSAITRASERILDTLGAWSAIEGMRMCPFRRMRAWDGESEAKIEFDSAQLTEPYLGHIVENNVIQVALTERSRQLKNIRWYCPATPKSIDLAIDLAIDRATDRASTKIMLDNSEVLRGRLIVGADGASSRIREAAGIEVDTYSYDQHALVAMVHTGLPQQDITWQRHVSSGPQAFLPLTGQRASMVWYNSADEVQRLLGLDDDAFARELEMAFPSMLGPITSVQARGAFPLRRQHAKTYVQSGVALVGDAAHTIHPHIGQGVNLGLLDAATLAEVVLKAHQQGRNFASLGTLRRFARWRRGNNLAIIAFSEAVYHAFSRQQLPLKLARELLFTAANKIGPLNHVIARYAMGLSGDLPLLAQGKSISNPISV